MSIEHELSLDKLTTLPSYSLRIRPNAVRGRPLMPPRPSIPSAIRMDEAPRSQRRCASRVPRMDKWGALSSPWCDRHTRPPRFTLPEPSIHLTHA